MPASALLATLVQLELVCPSCWCSDSKMELVAGLLVAGAVTREPVLFTCCWALVTAGHCYGGEMSLLGIRRLVAITAQTPAH